MPEGGPGGGSPQAGGLALSLEPLAGAAGNGKGRRVEPWTRSAPDRAEAGGGPRNRNRAGNAARSSTRPERGRTTPRRSDTSPRADYDDRAERRGGGTRGPAVRGGYATGGRGNAPGQQSRAAIAQLRAGGAPAPQAAGREHRDRIQGRRSAQQRRATAQAVSDPNEIRGGNGLLRRVLRRAERSGAEYCTRSRRVSVG